MITVRETLNTKFGQTSFRIPLGSTFSSANSEPPTYYGQYIRTTRGVEYFRTPISFEAEILYSNRNSDNELFSTSALFAGFTQSDIDFNSQALKNSFFVFEFMRSNGLTRFGYLFYNLTRNNLVLSEDTVTNVVGKAFIDREFKPAIGNEYPVSISFFNGRLGVRSRFYLGGAQPSPFVKFTDAKTLVLNSPKPLGLFESYSPLRERLQDNGGEIEYGLESNEPKIQGQGGQLFSLEQVVCGGDILFTENC